MSFFFAFEVRPGFLFPPPCGGESPFILLKRLLMDDLKGYWCPLLWQACFCWRIPHFLFYWDKNSTVRSPFFFFPPVLVVVVNNSAVPLSSVTFLCIYGRAMWAPKTPGPAGRIFPPPKNRIDREELGPFPRDWACSRVMWRSS